MPLIMNEMDIAFPHLNLYLRNVPKAIQIGNFDIAMYGIIVAFGMMMGIFMAAYAARKSGKDPDTYWDISIYLLLFSVIGARIYYVIFFWDGYKDNLLEVFNLRAGGLAIYGGVIAGVITIVAYCKIKKQDAVEMIDHVVYGLLIGQIIGRWANFMNREVFGGYTDSLFAMRLPIVMVRARDIDAGILAHIEEGSNYIQVHPTFLYESVWNLMILLLLLYLLRKKRFKGETSLIYFGGYGLGRAIIEAVRTDQLYIGNTTIPVNLVLGAVLFVGALAAFIVCLAMIGKGRIAVTDYSKVPEFQTKPKKNDESGAEGE